MNVLTDRCEDIGNGTESSLVTAEPEHELEKCDGIRFLGVVGVSNAEFFKISKYTIKRWVRACISVVIERDSFSHIL